jgi:protease-4
MNSENSESDFNENITDELTFDELNPNERTSDELTPNELPSDELIPDRHTPDESTQDESTKDENNQDENNQDEGISNEIISSEDIFEESIINENQKHSHEKTSDEIKKKSDRDYSAYIALIMILIGIFSVFYKTASHSDGLILNKSDAKGAIALLDISGVIRFTGDSSGFEEVMGYGNGAEAIISRIDSLSNMDQVKALVLRIDSPGGTVGAAQEICAALDRFRNVSQDGTPEKIVVASFGDTAASGAYYIAAACDEIFANPGTMTGSIGVVMQGMEFSNLMDKTGINEVTVKSGKYKDIGSPFRSMTQEEQEILQTMVDDCFDQFVERVAKGRKVTRDSVKNLGARIMTGRQAKDMGFVDFLGGLKSAVKRAGELSKLGSEPRVIKLNRSSIDKIFNRYFGSANKYSNIQEQLKFIEKISSFYNPFDLTAKYTGFLPSFMMSQKPVNPIESVNSID